MSTHTITSPRRSRKRLVVWTLFGLIGLSMGAVWATGFATFSTGASGTSTPSPVVVPGSPAEPTNPLASTVTANANPWDVTWAGDWGSSPATEFFQVDLTGQPTGETFNIALLLTNGAALTAASSPWQTLQLNVQLVQAAGASCAASDFTSGAGVARLFVFDSEDSAVYWNSSDADVDAAFGSGSGIVSGGTHPYCIGISAAAPPYDGSGTFLRAAGPNPPNVYPDFVTTVNRVS